MEGMKGIAVTIPADVFFIGGKILAVTVQIRQRVHVILLKQVVKLSHIRPSFIMEVSVADRGADDHAVIAHHSLMAHYLGGNGLHHHHRIGSHSIAVVEILGKAEDHHIVLLLCPGDIRPLIGRDPGMWLHYLCVTAVDLDLSGIGVQHRITAEKLLSHALFHMLANLIKLGAHKGMAADRCKILPVHHLGYMVGSNGTPVGDAGRTMFIAAGIASIGISLGVSNEDCNIAVIYIFVHEDRISPVCGTQIYHMVIILAVMSDDLMGIPELMKQLFPQDRPYLLLRASGVKAVGADHQDILFLHAHRIQFLKDQLNGEFPVCRRLKPPFYDIRENNHNPGAFMSQLCQRRHPHWIADGF